MWVHVTNFIKWVIWRSVKRIILTLSVLNEENKKIKREALDLIDVICVRNLIYIY